MHDAVKEGHLFKLAPVVQLRDSSELRLGSHVVTGDTKHPQHYNQASRHNKLGLVAKVSVRLLALRQLRIIKHFIKDSRIRHSLILHVNTVLNLVHLSAKVLKNIKTWD